LTSRRRKNLRKETDAHVDQGITIRTRRGAELSRDDAALVHRIYVSTVDKFVWGRRYITPAFFERVLTTFRDHVELVEATRDGQVIAGAFNVASATHLYGRYWGCFEEHPFLHFAVCYYHSIEECIRRGVKVFEGGAGGEHKLSRGFVPVVTRSVHRVFHPGLGRAIKRYVDSERESLASELSGIAEEAGMKPWTPPARG
jgi:predicted N-acyltransferase